MTPAEEITAAAEKLRRLATAASTDRRGRPTTHWAVRYQPGVLPGSPEQRDQPVRLVATDSGTDNHLLHGGPSGPGARGTGPRIGADQGRYIAAMGPDVGEKLARWLDAAAQDAREIGPDPHALAMARTINTGGQL